MSEEELIRAGVAVLTVAVYVVVLVWIFRLLMATA